MKVTIEKTPDETFLVSVESEQPGETNEAAPPSPESAGQESAEMSNAQPAKDLQEALMLAGKLLSQPDPNAGPSLFDQGAKSTMPTQLNKPPMQGM